MTLDICSQLIAAIGPIALAIMGVVVSLKPPDPAGRAHFLWAASFVLVGVITAAALFRELHGTDVAIDEIRGKVSGIKKHVFKGPRLEFFGITTTTENGIVAPSVNIANTSDVDAARYRIVASVSPYSDQKQINSIFKDAKNQLRTTNFLKVPTGGAFLSRNMGINLKVKPIADQDVEKIYKDGKNLYVILLAEYAGPDVEGDDIWVTEVCAKIIKPYNDFEPCPYHNGYFATNLSLSGIP